MRRSRSSTGSFGVCLPLSVRGVRDPGCRGHGKWCAGRWFFAWCHSTRRAATWRCVLIRVAPNRSSSASILLSPEPTWPVASSTRGSSAGGACGSAVLAGYEEFSGAVAQISAIRTPRAAPSVPRVRVVVVNYDGGELTRRCVDLLEACERPRDALEIVLVDNGSQDGVVERLEARSVETRVARLAKNRGFAAAVNVGLRRARRRRLRRPRKQRRVRLAGLAPPARGCARDDPARRVPRVRRSAGRPVRGPRYRRATAGAGSRRSPESWRSGRSSTGGRR